MANILTSVFTGEPAKNAAATNTGLYTGAKNQIYNLADITKRATDDYLNAGYGDAKTALGTGYDASTGAINTGATSALGYIDAGQTGATNALAQARSDLTANGGAYKPLADLATGYGGATNLYRDALGINGAEGTARAQSAFTAGPGYTWQVDQGLDAINRSRNARGALNSGNTDVDALKYGQGLASQEYSNWLNRLSPYEQLQLSATSGAATGNANINNTLASLGVTQANLANTGGQNRATIATNQGSSLADLANRYYGGLSNLDTSQGTALANNMNQNTGWLINAENNAAGNIAQQNTNAANAELTGSKNLLNLGTNLATLGVSGLGGSNWLSGFGGTKNTTGYSTNPWSSQGIFGAVA